MKFFYFILLTIICINSQTFTIKGIIKDKNDGSKLSFANVQILNSTNGTSSDINGEYILKVSAGKYALKASYIGYEPEILNIEIKNKDINIDFHLMSKQLEMQTVVVKPGINPALAIVQKAIESKQNRNKILETYELHSYTKAVAKSNRDFTTTGRSINLSLFSDNNSQNPDSLIIAGIIENESKSFFSKPNNYKDVIIARKQTANFPSSINVITGNRIIKNFYEETMPINNIEIPNPISDNALNYYYYILEDSLAYGNDIVYQIFFSPEDENNPGFTGKIFISKNDWSMVKIDCNINRAANIGGLMEEFRFYQQYLNYDGIYMPIDYRMNGKLNVFGIKFSFDFNTIMDSYKINKELSENVFDDIIVKVNKDADKKDSLYWQAIKLIEGKPEEYKAYFKFDSLKTADSNKIPEFTWSSSNFYLTKNLSFYAPLRMYHFNRVEGHAIDFGFDLRNQFNDKLNISGEISYGFSDKKFKQSLSARYFYNEKDFGLGSISFIAQNKLNTLFESAYDFSNLASTLNSFFAKYDERHYFYRKGFSINANQRITNNLRINFGYRYFEDRSAMVNSHFSILKSKEKYNINKSIDDANLSLINFGINLNLNSYKYIEDVDITRAIQINRNQLYLSASVQKALNENKFTKYSLGLTSYIRSFGTTTLRIIANTSFADGTLPLQYMNAVSGSMMGVTKDYSFRTVEAGQIYGDKLTTLSVDYNFNDELFKLFGLSFLRKWEITLNTYFNMAYVETINKSKAYNLHPSNEYKKPLMELGFGLGHKIVPFTVEFTWRLNYTKEKNFQFSLGIPLL